jgi:hypothetical protein
MKSLPKCFFREWLWGPKSHWPKEGEDPKEAEKEEKRKKWRQKYAERSKILCECLVEAKYGLVPSLLGIGYWCGHMVGYDEVYHYHVLVY